MDGIEKITTRISEDIEQQINAINEEAQQKASEITARYNTLARQAQTDILSRGKSAAEERKERLSGVAHLEVNKRILAEKQALLDEAFQSAMTELTSLPEEQYVALLTNLAVKGVRKGTEQLIFSQADRTRYGKKVVSSANEHLNKAGKKAALTLSESVRPMKGGLVLSDGDIEVNCTFETILRLLRREIAGQVANALFD